MSPNFLRNSIFLFLTIPAGIALVIGSLPFPIVLAERAFAGGAFSPFVLQLDAASARTLLSVVATGAMTALSLAYSLVLVVFTLAAGNIGPRLLKRFSSDLVNQITAGVLGGTFLYALSSLLCVRHDFVPKATVTGAVLLAVMSVLQLIYFVRNVSKSVSVDDEIAQISKRISVMLDTVGRTSSDRTVPDHSDFYHTVRSEQAGYVGRIDRKALVACAAENDFAIWIKHPPGSFVLPNSTLLDLSRDAEPETEDRLRSLVPLEPARSDDQTVTFSINLLVEIALRALSPGVNDIFTALAVVNSLSNIFAEMSDEDYEPIVLCDDGGSVRLVLAGLTMKQLVGQAFHPLRRAAGANILMAQGLARAFARLHSTESKRMRKVIVNHARLLITELHGHRHLDEDVESVIECLSKPLKERAGTDRRE